MATRFGSVVTLPAASSAANAAPPAHACMHAAPSAAASRTPRPLSLRAALPRDAVRTRRQAGRHTTLHTRCSATHQAVGAADGHGGLGTVLGEGVQAGAGAATQDHGYRQHVHRMGYRTCQGRRREEAQAATPTRVPASPRGASSHSTAPAVARKTQTLVPAPPCGAAPTQHGVGL